MQDINSISYKTNTWFFFSLLYLVVDYGRPQDILPIAVLRPAMVVILVLLYYLVTNNGISRSNSKQTKLIWYFVILTAMYIPFAVNNYWALQTTRNMLTYMPFILSTIILVNSVKRLKKIITVYIALMIYIALYSISHDGMGSGNYFLDENDVALYLNIWLPFCFLFFIYEKGKYAKLFYAIGLIVGLAAIVISFSRGGFVGLLGVAAVIWYYSPKKLLSLLIILIAGSLIYILAGEKYINEMSTVTDTNEGTAQTRIKSWESAWDMFIDNPLGVGGNNFQTRFPDYQSDRFERGMAGRVAHSLWFTLIPELGIFGILIYFSLLYYNFRDIFYLKNIKINDKPDLHYLHILSIALIAALAGFFASASFLSVLYYPHYWYLTALIIATKNISHLYINQKTHIASTNSFTGQQ